MKQHSLFLPAATAALTLLSFSQAFAAGDPKGVWMDDSGRGAIEIKPCGQALCGYVVAVKNANDQKGCGKQIIGDAQPAGSGLWSDGWIYSPEKRKNYDVELKPLNDGTLRVVGYAGTKLFSRTMIWTRAAANLQRCDTQTKAAPPPDAPPPVAKPAPIDAAAPPAAVKPATPPVAAAAPATAAPKVVARTEAAPTVAEPKTDAAIAQVPKAIAPADTKPNATVKSEQVPPAEKPSSDAVAQNNGDDDSEAGEKPGKRRSGGGLKLGGLDLKNLDLDKVVSRTASGKCKIDLPFVKVQFDCDGD